VWGRWWGIFELPITAYLFSNGPFLGADGRHLVDVAQAAQAHEQFTLMAK